MKNEKNDDLFNEFEAALDLAKIRILRHEPAKQRPVVTDSGTMSFEKFRDFAISKLGSEAVKVPEVFKVLHNISELENLIRVYAKQKKITVRTGKLPQAEIEEFSGLTLNFDLTAKKDNKFFMTNKDEAVVDISGEAYLGVRNLKLCDAVHEARRVIPAYRPRDPAGVTVRENQGRSENIFNTYTPPLWRRHKRWKDLPDGPPKLFKKLINHLFPIVEEREFFLDWLHDSLFKRAFTFLILCSKPGTGKNRLKLVMRALHGHTNTVDGKRSTLVERFNSQHVNATLVWFDELKYDEAMENVMKELQNDSISIERKGVDATRATPLYSSIVITNNKPRDNYIAFDARKFAPLFVDSRPLKLSMTTDEIDKLSMIVEKEENIDVAFIAQIVKWLQKRGSSGKWPNLEYQGPMFWTLAHSSMNRWQKSLISFLLNPKSKNPNNGWDGGSGEYRWSELEQKVARKNDRYMQFPDASSVSYFLETFKDRKGAKVFKTKPVKGLNIMGDFTIKLLFELEEIAIGTGPRSGVF